MEVMYYLFKVSACTVLFFAFYLLVLRRLTFFKINRFYLLFTLIISFIIPTLHFTVEREIVQAESIITPETVPITEVTNQAFEISVQKENVVALEEGFDYYSLLPYLYLSIVVGLLLVASWRLFQLVKHTRKSVEKINGLKIVSKAKGFTNCSFFNYVFIDERNLTEVELKILLKHEEVHAKQFHSIDKIILMIIKAVLWFNPIVYLYDKALEEAHEYEADDATSQNYGTTEYAGLLLRLAISKSEMPLVHNFVKSPIKERIKMLFNSKSKNMKKLMYLLALPIGLALIWGFTVDVVDVLPTAKNDDSFTLVLDAGHGGKNLGATAGGFTEKDITLAMAKKIKAIAEAKGLKVVLTRNNDEFIDLATRAKINGNVLLSLHVNEEPANLGGKGNGIEMFTSGSYDGKDMKLAKSTSLTYSLYKNLKNIVGIKINNKPINKRLVILNNATSPGVVLEMGYLTNKNDFNYITNSTKQEELAKLIVDGIIDYKQNLPSDEKMAKFQKSADDFSVELEAWKASDKYKILVAEAKTVKNQTLIGQIQSLNYFNRATLQDLDGFILKVNNKTYRVYLTKEQLKMLSIKVGDKVSIFAPKAEVWFDSDFPVIKPEKVTVLESVGLTHDNSKPKLIAASTMNVDTKNNITYIKKGIMEIGDVKLEAEDITWDTNNGIITAKSATLTSKNGDKVVSKSIIYDVKKGTYKALAASGNAVTKSSTPSPYIVNKSPEVENPTFSAAYQLLSKLKLSNDSLKMGTILDKTLFISGNVKLNLDGYSLNGRVVTVDKDSNLITAHLATLINKDGSIINADVIEFDLISKNYKVTKPVGAAYMYMKN